MDSRFAASRDELYNVQMELKQVQATQHNHTERLLRVEKRLAEDAAVKSVWATSPFPSALSGTPQHGPLQIPPSDVFDDFAEHGQNLLGSLHLDAEDEPVRRGAASRANSVRFDESALHGASWGTRQSGDLAPVRPSSGFGMMERSLSHKSDGRHSSAGHSVHSVHSLASGRGSSLGLDTHFIVGEREEDSPVDIPAPPPGLFVLGSVPAIVRCWLSENFAHNTLLYADVCSGAQRSTLDFSLAKELGLAQEVQKGADGVSRLTLTVFLAEAIVTQSSSTKSPATVPNIPCMTVNFEMTGMEQAEPPESKKAIRIFIGTDALRAHSADLLFSQNLMTLYNRDRDKLSVPFVRPEDDSLFRFLATTNMVPEKQRLNASAPEFFSSSAKSPRAEAQDSNSQAVADRGFKGDNGSQEFPSPLPADQVSNPVPSSAHSESGAESDRGTKDKAGNIEPSGSDKEASSLAMESARRDSSGIWGSWRNSTSANGGESAPRSSENGLSGYQPAGRSRMKVLKPSKSTNSSSARTGPSYEPPPPARTSGEHRRKSHGAVVAADSTPTSATSSAGNTARWEKRSAGSIGPNVNRETTRAPPFSLETRSSSSPSLPRSVNPVGGASAFSWMTPSPKPKTPTVAE